MAQNLLDTHTLIWYLNGASELSRNAKAAIEAEDVVNFVSIASLWEMAIKISLGKLELSTPFNQISRQIQENGFEVLPLAFEDTLIVSTLPLHHRDPFDRIIIAQSINQGLTLISRDENFKHYKTKVLW